MNIFVGNLPATATAEDLRRLFSGYGTTVNAIIMRDSDSGLPLGYGHVYVVPDPAAYEAIINLNSASLNGCPVAVRECVYRAQHDRRTTRSAWIGPERRVERSRRLNGIDQSSAAAFLPNAG